MANDIKRLNYFTGQYLVQEDFLDEQTYHKEMRWRRNRVLYGPGVLEGMLVSQNASKNGISISPGTALNDQGRELVFVDAATQAIPNGLTGKVNVIISYEETPTDYHSVGEYKGATRFTEKPKIDIQVAPATVTQITLACLQLDANSSITSVDTTIRQLADARFPRNLTTNGSVGIGTTDTKSYRLMVAGGDTRIAGPGQEQSLFGLDRLVGVNDLRFYVDDSGTTEQMHLSPSGLTITGNVGIGTTAPSDKLVVSGGRIGHLESGSMDGNGKWSTLGVPNLGFAPNAANCYGLKVNWDTDAVVFGLKDYGANKKDAIIAWGDDPDNNLRFLKPNDADAMIITGSGNVGIGTTNPSGKLDVNGDIYRAGLLAISGEAGGWLRINQNNDFPKGTHFASRANFNGGITTGNWWDVDPGAGNLLVQGNAGIGTSNPGRKLDVSGAIRASDEIQTTSPNAFRMIYGSFGSFFRNDGNDTYFLLTNAGDPYGGWNGLRPLRINNASGNIFLGNLDVADNFTASVGCGDFKIGHSSRRGSTGRALVDYTDTLHINYGPDWANVIVHGKFTNSSTKDVKKNIKHLTSQKAFEILEVLNPVEYNFKFDKERRNNIGFIAEEVPEIVGTRDKKSVAYLDIIAVLTKVIQEHQNAINKLMTAAKECK
jgi:hypothetical protein